MQRCLILNNHSVRRVIFNKILLIAVAWGVGISCSGPQTNTTAPSATTAVSEESSTIAPRRDVPVILFFGNSLSAGYGLDPDDSFPGLIQRRLDSLGYDMEVVNAGVTGETTATGKNRLDWVLNRNRVDIFVLELGANDGLRGLPTEETHRNLNDIISGVEQRFPDAEIVLAGMMIPPNMGAAYCRDFEQVFTRLAAERDIHLIPFLLEGVAGEAHLNLEDGIHPNIEGQRMVAATVWTMIEPLVKALDQTE